MLSIKVQHYGEVFVELVADDSNQLLSSGILSEEEKEELSQELLDAILEIASNDFIKEHLK